MPIDMKADVMVELSKSGSLFPNPKPGRSALWRWAMKGSRGIKLETVLYGTRRMTTQAAVDQFLEAINSPRPAKQQEESAPVAMTKARRRRQTDAAMKALSDAGL